MIKFFRTLTLIPVLLISSFVTAQVVNPIAGVWSNRQTLVIDMPATSNAFYSVSGEDPEKSGLAYDGPALLDVEGNVTVNIAIIDKDGNKTEQSISYVVKPAELPADDVQRGFVEKVLANGSVDYTAGDVFSIPGSLQYTFGSENPDFEDGEELSIGREMVLNRNLPCTVTDGNGLWRFIIKVHPAITGLYTRKDVPFQIVDWDTFVFTDRTYIYKIDDQWWGQPKEKIKLDRSKNHMISWQAVDYSNENIVKFFVVPPKPDLSTNVSNAGNVTVSIKGDEGYKFGIINEKGEASELFDTLSIDTFKGDNYSGKITAGLYFDSVYQGSIQVPFNVHKKNPLAPVIIPDTEGKFLRSKVKVSVRSPENNVVYAAVKGPVILDEDYSSETMDNLFDLSEDSFVKMKGKAFTLSPSADGAAAYRIRAYSVDSSKNISMVSEYSVIIDQCNYYVNGAVSDPEKNEKADGSRENPFPDFTKIVPLINKSRFVHVRVEGDVKLPAGNIVLYSNCQIEGKNSARLILNPETAFVVRNASLTFTNLLMTLSEESNPKENSSVFQLERSVLYLNGVELSAVFGKNGTVINADNSVINIENTGLTATAENYASLVSAVESKVTTKNSRLTSCAATAVNFSCQGGLFDLSGSKCKVVGSMGRIAELFDTHSTIVNNTLDGDLKKGLMSNKAIYTDAKNYSVAYEQNIESGF